MTVVALLRPAHLPQPVSNQSCSVKRTAPVISESVRVTACACFARARLVLFVISPAFELIDIHGVCSQKRYLWCSRAAFKSTALHGVC